MTWAHMHKILKTPWTQSPHGQNGQSYFKILISLCSTETVVKHKVIHSTQSRSSAFFFFFLLKTWIKALSLGYFFFFFFISFFGLTTFQGFPGSSVVKNQPANAGDKSLILEGNGNPLQYFYLGNPTWYKELTHWKRPWSWEILKAEEMETAEDETVR